MDRYYTLMLIPEKNKNVFSIKIPEMLFKGLVFLIVFSTVLASVLVYDYWNILGQVYENKHLLVENRELKEQVQLFQMKLNTIAQDLERINVFERKLRAITGLEEIKPTTVNNDYKALPNNQKALISEPDAPYNPNSLIKIFQNNSENLVDKMEHFEELPQFIDIKKHYEEKISNSFSKVNELNFATDWTFLTRQSQLMAPLFAEFDVKFDVLDSSVKTIELNIQKLDQHLLNKESFLKSTPTLLPAQGTLTSYYGPRMSPYAGRIKMHEGLDVGASIGTPIVAPADGVITFSGPKPGFGNFVQIDHGYGIETIFGHASMLAVKKGQRISRGELIAKVGNTGYSTGPHLHYEVRVKGTPVDPLYYVLN